METFLFHCFTHVSFACSVLGHKLELSSCFVVESELLLLNRKGVQLERMAHKVLHGPSAS